jgi:hypothetical protein
MRALVPAAVLLMTCAALLSHFSPGALDAQAASRLGELSTRGLWADEHGNTVLVTEHVAEVSTRAIPNAELRFLGPDGRTNWVMPLGSGAISALADADDVLYLGLSATSAAAGHDVASTRTQVLAVSMVSGQRLWSVDVAGEVTDLLPDATGGLRARSLRLDAEVGSEHLMSLRDGVLLWDVALED